MLRLVITSRTDPRLLERMAIHYSQPKGFVGRSICYAIYYNDVYYGHIVAGSTAKYLDGRDAFLGLKRPDFLDRVISNTFYNVSKVDDRYPIRNFTTTVVKLWMKVSEEHWRLKYGNSVVGFDTLIELPRTGELYIRAGFTVVGQTKGYTIKRVGGKSTDTWTGQRVWDKTNLRPKLVLAKKNT